MKFRKDLGEIFGVTILLLILQSQASMNFSKYSSCSDWCTCRHDNTRKILVKCMLNETKVNKNKNKDTGFQLPPVIDEMDLSNNGLTKVPTEFLKNHSSIRKLILDNNDIKVLPPRSFEFLSSLEILSINYNSIHSIENNSFAGLFNLRSLDLEMKDLHSWKTHNLPHDLPILQRVDITGTIFWVPDASLLKLPNLTELIGVTWCKFCTNCTLVKAVNVMNDTTRRGAAEECRQRFNQYKFMEIGKSEPKRFVSHGFIPECMCVKETECEFRQLVMPYFEKRDSLPQYLFYLEYAISPFTILFNLIVLVVIISRKALRSSPSFFLLANMAFVDVIVGIYSISVAEVNIKEIRTILEELMWTGQKLRSTTGPIFIAGQLISVLISSILTVERYIVVVYCVTSNLKLSMKATLISLAVAWGIAITFAILPIFGVAGLHYNIKRACAPLSYDLEYQSQSSTVLITMLILIVLLYFLNVPLYFKIFRFVKGNTGKAVTGVKKEVSLARKIATLILTNFVFFAIPIILILTISIFSEYDDNPFDFSGNAFKSTVFKIIIGQWLPVTCLNINALLDPFLYAFRHSLFRQEMKSLVFRYTGKVLPLNESFSANPAATKIVN